jgi:hypothetical protein
MATKVAIAIRQRDALARVMAAVEELRGRFELEAVDLTPRIRDVDLARAVQLEGLASLLEAVAGQVAKLQVAGSETGQGEKRPRRRGAEAPTTNHE